MDLIGEALVKIKPDLTGLRFQVQTGVAQALRGLDLGALAGATAGLSGATASLSATQLGLAGSAVAAADAEGTLTVALRAAGLAAGTTAAENVALAASHLGISGAAAQTAGGLTVVGDAGKKGGAGVKGFSDQSNIARGALIGLSRITPVAVFGLGVVGTAAIAAGLALRSSISLAADFEQSLNVIAVVSEATAEELEQISDVSKELGSDLSLPAVSAGDATTAMLELSKAGLSVEDSVDAARGVLELGVAANIDFASSAKIAASALNAFDLPGRRASEIADLLAASSIAAQGEITDMAAALTQSSAVAKQANISIEDTVTAISLLAKNGLLGSDAGTSLRTTILRLVPTTKEAATFVRALGIEFEDAAGNLRPLPAIFEDYREVLSKLPPVLQQAALQQIFGQDAIRAASILAREGAAGFSEMATEVTREGVASEIAAARSQGFNGAVAGLTSNLETLGITLGTIVLPGLTALVEVLGLTAGAINTAVDAAVDGVNRVKEADFGDAGFLDDMNEGLVGVGEGVNGIVDSVPGLSDLRGFFRDSGDDVADLNQALGVSSRQFQAQGEQISENDQRLKRLVQALGRAPTNQEVSFIVSADTFENGVRQVVQRARQAGTTIAEAFGKPIEKVFDPVNTRSIGRAGESLIDGSRKFTDAAAAAAGKSGGEKWGDNFADAISASEQKTIDAARRAVTAAQEAASEQTRDAAFSAIDNLDALGQSLNSQLETLIDTGPIAQKIEELQARLDKLTGKDEAADLRERRRVAGQGLREARESLLTGVGTLSPQARREQREFLKPFEDGVRDADAALKEFDLSNQIEGLDDMKEAAKEAASTGLANLVQRFKDGKISAGEFEALLSRQLAPALKTLKSEAGENLGLSFSAGFLQNVQNLKDQVSALVGFLGLTAGPSPDVVRPGEVASEGAERVSEARKNLREAIENARKTAGATTESSDTLRRIERILLTQAAREPASPGGSKITTAELANIRAVTSRS